MIPKVIQHSIGMVSMASDPPSPSQNTLQSLKESPFFDNLIEVMGTEEKVVESYQKIIESQQNIFTLESFGHYNALDNEE